MQGMTTGFSSVHTDLLTWIVPLGALFLLGGALIAAWSYRYALQHWGGGLLAIALAASSLAVATATYNYFHM